MATILLQAAGGVVGGLVGGPFGAMLGRGLGALAGASLDAQLFGETRKVEGARLGLARVMEADEGAGIARVYGTMRIAGQMIWATRFEERRQTERQGGKGGGRPQAEVTTYSYRGNFAVGLCEGPIAGIRRVWADGEELDLTGIEMRLHRGDEAQAPDPLIEARQGAGRAPAYRGLAYLVFEGLALERWGNRLPQISCEVMRPVGALEEQLRAVTIIPGASEHGLDPRPVRERVRDGEDRVLNRNVLHGASDWSASVDELEALAPRLERAALVVSWFGDDLRAGHCRIRPAVETARRDESETWFAGGLERSEARTVGQADGGPAYGGTPSDAGVLRAMADLKRRGLKVTYYPFLLMDIAPGNRRPDPYGGTEQAAFPWRGRITLGGANRTAAARTEIAAFLGTARASDFAFENGRLRYQGSDGWTYRRMVLHQAHLAARGAADAFVIGSELRGLTQVRDAADRFPFVEGLMALAEEVRTVLPKAVLTYAADWSEYFGHQPADGSGDVFFHLDPLWAHPAIDVVGIDDYLPLSDWRDDGAANADGARSPYDRAALRAGIAGGEHGDWFYRGAADRLAGRRTPIADGAAGKPWVFRPKDRAGWWSNPHHDRRGGVELPEASPWLPCSKPIWLTELGCPATDKGANEPNVFIDPKSAESRLPHHSAGGRDDLAQRRYLEVRLGALDPASPDFLPALNPLSPVYGGRMIDPGAVHVWTWDARPYPAFPARNDVWRDGGNWRLGHWLNGRLGTAPGDGLHAAICRDAGLGPVEGAAVEAPLTGLALSGPSSARDILDGLGRLTGTDAVVAGGQVTFRPLTSAGPAPLLDGFADGEGAYVEIRRAEAGERPEEISLSYLDAGEAYRPAAASAGISVSGAPRIESVDLPVALDEEGAAAFAAGMLGDTLATGETARFALSPARLDIEPGDVVRLAGQRGRWRVTSTSDGEVLAVEARRLPERRRVASLGRPASAGRAVAPVSASRPRLELLDLPMPENGVGLAGMRLALGAKPWIPQVVSISVSGGPFVQRASAGAPATMGWLTQALPPGPEGVFDRAASLMVRLDRGALASVGEAAVLAGANLCAVKASNGLWEVLQFTDAEEVAPMVFRLGTLLRGQGGTEDAVSAGAPAGAAFVALDEAVTDLGFGIEEAGRLLDWRIAPAGRPLDDPAVRAFQASVGARCLRPLSPVHLRARFAADGGVAFAWIRRTRVGGDAFEAIEVPLAEEGERYRVAVSNGASQATFETGEPRLALEAAEQVERFGSLPGALTLTVSQVSLSQGPGTARSRTFRRQASS